MLGETANTELKRLCRFQAPRETNRQTLKRSSWPKGVWGLGSDELVIDLKSLNFFEKQNLRTDPCLKVPLFTSIFIDLPTLSSSFG